ncbi:MAG: putative zinc-binding metallopeptidase [Paludibacteraceae bacterium]|nr:putative zinc-binding metallopeptidase [Paludibacteraceae bacterium]
MKTSRLYLIIPILTLAFASCEEKFSDSIFEDVPALNVDSTTYTYEFDKWLYENYTVPYNIQFLYKLEDLGSDFDYNLVPASYEKAQQVAHLAIYLWFDVYKKVVGPDFLKQYGPRIIHLIGSYAINPSQGTIKLGTAEGGAKITLYGMNPMDATNIDDLNQFIFHTMHHEFAHILHQTKTYPKTYETITSETYDPVSWSTRSEKTANELGYVTNYASMQAREDFVEVISCYITYTDSAWNSVLTQAAEGKIDDQTTGRDIIEQKFAICKTWLADKWNIDIEELRREVQYRQSHMDLEKVMNDEY